MIWRDKLREHVCSTGQRASPEWRGQECSAYLENSRTASVVSSVFSFFTSNIFLGGEGHRRDRRSLPFASASVSKIIMYALIRIY